MVISTVMTVPLHFVIRVVIAGSFSKATAALDSATLQIFNSGCTL